jgi:hypothetical protein
MIFFFSPLGGAVVERFPYVKEVGESNTHKFIT